MAASLHHLRAVCVHGSRLKPDTKGAYANCSVMACTMLKVKGLPRIYKLPGNSWGLYFVSNFEDDSFMGMDGFSLLRSLPSFKNAAT